MSPSPAASPLPKLIGARPLMMMPPQSPRPRCPIGWSLVKTIGAAAVPMALIRPPRSTISVPTLPDSPMTRAGLDVERAAGRTNTAPRRT